jgi:hypothetical protein
VLMATILLIKSLQVRAKNRPPSCLPSFVPYFRGKKLQFLDCLSIKNDQKRSKAIIGIIVGKLIQK